MSGGKMAAQKVAIADRSSRALTLRKTGASFRAIAQAIQREFDIPKYNDRQAARDVDRALTEIAQRTSLAAPQVRTLELERLDTYLLSIARDVQNGDLSAIDRALKISERRAKLLGIEAPIQLKVEELVTARIDAEFDLFFTQIQSDSILTDDAKRRILEIAKDLGDRAAVAANN